MGSLKKTGVRTCTRLESNEEGVSSPNE